MTREELHELAKAPDWQSRHMSRSDGPTKVPEHKKKIKKWMHREALEQRYGKLPR